MTLVVKLQGGLGNQMFQFALGQKLNFSLNKEVIYDASCLDTFKQKRSLLLNRFPKLYNFSAGKEDMRYWVVRESDYEFNPQKFVRALPYMDLANSLCFEGYWQSEQFFEDISHIIRENFKLKGYIHYCCSAYDQYDGKDFAVEEQILRRPSVAIHVRRGDYLKSINKKVFVELPFDYYKKALRKIFALEEGKVNVFIFSDDLEWCRKNIVKKLHALRSVVNEVHTVDTEEVMSLYLMGRCKYQIIANSSFSWWGAWLSETQKIFCPEKWFKKPEYYIDKYICPDRWFKVQF